MADHPHDSTSYRSLPAKTVRAMDGAGDILRDYVHHLGGKKGPAGLVSGAVLFGGAPFAAAALFAAVAAPDAPAVPRDADLSGKGLLNRTYAYQAVELPDAAIYLMVRDNGRYELYQWIESRNRSELVTDYAVARQIAGELAAETQNILQNRDFDGTATQKVAMWSCDGLYEAANDGNATFRAENSCPRIETTGASLRAHYQRAESFWTDVLSHMTAGNYGPQADKIHDVRVTEDARILETATDTGLVGLGLWAGLAAFGTAAAGLRRRAGMPGRGIR